LGEEESPQQKSIVNQNLTVRSESKTSEHHLQ